MTDREVMKQAFDALQRARNQVVQLGRLCEVAPDTKEVSNAIGALRAALAEPVQEQEPVAPARRPLTPAQEAAPELHAEIERLRAEIERLRALLDTAGLTRAQAEHNALRAERDALRAALERVQALAYRASGCSAEGMEAYLTKILDAAREAK